MTTPSAVSLFVYVLKMQFAYNIHVLQKDMGEICTMYCFLQTTVINENNNQISLPLRMQDFTTSNKGISILLKQVILGESPPNHHFS